MQAGAGPAAPAPPNDETAGHRAAHRRDTGPEAVAVGVLFRPGPGKGARMKTHTERANEAVALKIHQAIVMVEN